MRGSPVFRAAIAAILLALAGIPIWQLTHPTEAPAPAAPAASATPTATREAELLITSSRPASVTAQYAGRNVFQSASPIVSGTASLTLPNEPADLVIKAAWADSSAPNALRATVTIDGDSVADQSLWGSSEASGVLTVPTSTP